MPPRLTSGFSLVESLIALLVLSVALLMGLPLIQQQPGIVKRLDAQHVALREIESTVEAMRSGVMPLQSIHLAPSPGQPSLWVDVQPETDAPAGLYHVTVRALWRIQGKDFEKKVETLIWSPPE
ncbi:MAG TPA: prepilin-type N-terminal cleavage/methylation domain-containing protein [Thermoanaerobaculia bacterium]|jgi:prepilin-type N-terminal cleavage/methylation domain-containing protein|nr:prepilin-type N-terminal cleavage/methylation domain-containing protein [Thermoanaerobaculia bacterium]